MSKLLAVTGKVKSLSPLSLSSLSSIYSFSSPPPNLKSPIYTPLFTTISPFPHAMQKPLNTSQFSTMHSSSSEEDENALGKAGYVGVESYVDLQSNLNLEPYKWFSSGGGEDAGLMRKKKKVKLEREYPPPIPWLARTDHCAFSQMQWEMKRYYTSDGRLIIKEEKAKRFEYFEVHRTDGRLMLNLVPLNDDGSESNSDDDDGDVSETDDYDEGKVDGTAEENESPLVNGGGAPAIGGGGSGGIKCSSLCTFGIAVPASRPVHT